MKNKIALIWGLVGFFVFVSFKILFFILDNEFSNLLLMSQILVLILTIISSFYFYRSKVGVVSKGELLKLGITIGVIFGVGNSILNLIYPLYISPDYNQSLIKLRELYLISEGYKIEDVILDIETFKFVLEPKMVLIKSLISEPFKALLVSLPLSIVISREK
jgi:hypothetical protein